MAGGLSVLARLLKQGRFEEFETGEGGPRRDPRLPAQRGFTRGTTGVTGVRSPGAPATRNPNAQEDEERAMVQSPIMSAFLSDMQGV